MKVFWLTILPALTTAAICLKDTLLPVCGGEFKAYNSTFLPNLLGQWSASEVAQTAAALFPLRAVGCSAHLDLFLCSTLSPVCPGSNPEGVLPYLIPIPPCQNLCEIVVSDCAGIMEEFGIDLPELFNCRQFPDSRTQPSASCIPPSDHTEPLPKSLIKWTKTQVKLDPAVSKGLQHQCPKALMISDDSKTFAGIASCEKPCDPMAKETRDVTLVRMVMAVFCVVSAMISSFSIIIFLKDRKRFVYPERPTLYFALCYFIISITVLATLISPEESACAAKSDESGISALFAGWKSSQCVVTFSIVFFFQVAATMWWLVLVLIWGLSLILDLNLEVIESKGRYLHLFAWTPALALTTIAVLQKRIQADPFLGICALDGDLSSFYFFSLLPLVSLTLIGLVTFIAGLKKLLCVNSDFGSVFTSAPKLEQFLFRISAFSCCFLIPKIAEEILKMSFSSLAPLLESTWYHDNCADLGVPCPLGVSPNKYIEPLTVLLRYVFFIIPSWAPMVWLANGKSLRAWGINSDSHSAGIESSLEDSSLSSSQHSREDSQIQTV